MKIRLTQTAKRAGCAAKQAPGYLLPLLAGLPPITDPNVLIGNSSADDAAIYKLDDSRALVLTTDFFTPIVDDPYDFGAVAAANALSDVYAMGGRPLTALNLVGFPAELPLELLAEILRGGAEKSKEAGIDLVGGHTIKSEEPIYGLAVTGIVDPAKVVSNAGGQVGDKLVLTKPIGVGIIATAAKRDVDHLNAISEAIASMCKLNRGAAEAMQSVGVNAATDVTGFGLLGHLRNVAAASQCSARIEAARVPVFEAARAYAHEDVVPGGTHSNHAFLRDWVSWPAELVLAEQLILADAQTSGGLLISVSPDKVDALQTALRAQDCLCADVVGELVAGEPGHMQVV